MDKIIDKNSFKYVKINSCDFDVQEKIKDDQELLRFINANSNETRVIFYKDVPIGFKCETSYFGVPEFQCALFKEFRGMGIANYLLEDFRDRKFKENYRAISLLIHKDNEASIKSARKNGFILDDTNEELNPVNKEDMYYTFYSFNANYDPKKRR